MTNINVEFLRDIFVSGTNNISNNYKDIDALNVFPIPDGPFTKTVWFGFIMKVKFFITFLS